MTSAVRAKLDRRQALVHRREGWRVDLDSGRRLHTRGLDNIFVERLWRSVK